MLIMNINTLMFVLKRLAYKSGMALDISKGRLNIHIQHKIVVALFQIIIFKENTGVIFVFLIRNLSHQLLW